MQEHNAEAVAEALKRSVAVRATVRRDGVVTPVPVEDIAKYPVKNASKFFSAAVANKVAELIKQAASAPGSAITELAEQLDVAVQKQFLKLLAR